MQRWARAIVVLAVLAGGVGLLAQRAAAPASPAGTAGLAADRLARLHRGMQGFVDRHEVGGIVTLLARGGRVADIRAYGYQDVESRTPMRPDTLFRIASMSKPITSVAVMMLLEEGKLSLTDPVSRFIPAFRDVKVAAPAAQGAELSLVAVRRPITIRDLLTHRAGLTYGFLDGGPIGTAYRKAGITDGLDHSSLTLAENMDRLASVPLVSMPGAEWHYSLSTDVLGRVVEVASGTTFDVFLRERLFTPLKMTTTSFDVPEALWSRMATVYSPDGKGGIRPMRDPESFGNAQLSPVASYKTGKKYFSGGAGLVSTAQDYLRFGQMLLNGGELDGVRLLGPKTIALMTASHTADLPPSPIVGAGAHFGLGFKVTMDLATSQALGSDGMYGWSGLYGTTFWVDPRESLVAIMMVQRYPGAPVAGAFQTLAYQAIVGPPGR